MGLCSRYDSDMDGGTLLGRKLCESGDNWCQCMTFVVPECI
jgi:hypothetical protein